MPLARPAQSNRTLLAFSPLGRGSHLHAIMGPSGSGKSSFITALIGKAGGGVITGKVTVWKAMERREDLPEKPKEAQAAAEVELSEEEIARRDEEAVRMEEEDKRRFLGEPGGFEAVR